MPTYDYECQACGTTVEIFHGINETPRPKCPECGARRLKRQIGSGAGFLFRGSGFYITDYRSEDYKRKAKAEAGGGSGDAGLKTSAGSKEKSSSGGDSSGGDSSGGKAKAATPSA